MSNELAGDDGSAMILPTVSTIPALKGGLAEVDMLARITGLTVYVPALTLIEFWRSKSRVMPPKPPPGKLKLLSGIETVEFASCGVTWLMAPPVLTVN